MALVYVYVCQNSSCQYVEREGGMKHTNKKCPKCGRHMRCVDKEKY